MTSHIRPFWRPFSTEFRCPNCSADDATQSRARGFFEANMLPILLLQPVRCERCYLRSYVSRWVPARERPQRKPPNSETNPASGKRRVA
jgi:hypothetical protein